MSNPPGLSQSAMKQNIIPDTVDRDSIQQAIDEAELRLATHQDSEADAKELRSRIEVLSSLLAPIHRLPPKILASIFLDPVLHASVPRGSLTSGFGGRGLGPITAVSSHWRTTALSTPQFWSRFTILLPGNDNVARLLELYLERSNPCTLSLEIRAPHPGPVHHGILKQLLDSCGRWSTLHLSTDSSQLSLFSSARGHLQSLKILDLRARVSPMDSIAQMMEEVEGDAFELAPKLSMLRQCPNLTTLSATYDFRAADYPPYMPASVTAHTLSTFPFMLEFITAPCLEDLHLASGGPSWTSAWFSSFIQRSGCHPHTLHLADVVIASTDLLAVLPLIPTVHSLILRSLRPHAVTDKLLAGLTAKESESSQPLLPALTNLSLRGSYLFTNTALLDMLESRVNFQPPIQRIKLRLTQRQFSDEQLDCVRALQRNTSDMLAIQEKILSASRLGYD
ncbi:hypothetical protein GGX14DRAFT_461372 [Mycena pura]|uniref:F-box domain-containing protein n=1 Tax=Mycena pura TaxID=153505 RepID=A0AAD6V5Z4_9AGAR|nr:hypothetical protein GGX14DRAFT_461372 [Mycena pura]